MYLGLMKLRFPLPYFHSGLGMTSWSLETSPTPVTVHRQPANSPSWALESFASSLMFRLTTKFSWSIRIRTTPVRLHHECDLPPFFAHGIIRHFLHSDLRLRTAEPVKRSRPQPPSSL